MMVVAAESARGDDAHGDDASGDSAEIGWLVAAAL
jgi:hypothetical protein